MRVISLFLLALLAFTASAQPSGPLVLNGKFTQGSLFRGQLPEGSEVALDGKILKTNSQGKFVFGFERTAGLHHVLSWTLPSGEKGQRDITLAKRNYNIQRIDGLASNMVSPPESTLQRIRTDAANVSRARAGKRDLDAVFTGFIWPAKGPITGVYGSQRILNGKPKSPHYGVDVGSPKGTPVVAPADGVVTLVDDLYYSGNTLILDHGMGVFSTFLHLDTMRADVGDHISQGEQIGTIGDSGRATGPHLDWRINLNNMRLDPALLVPDRE